MRKNTLGRSESTLSGGFLLMEAHLETKTEDMQTLKKVNISKQNLPRGIFSRMRLKRSRLSFCYVTLTCYPSYRCFWFHVTFHSFPDNSLWNASQLRHKSNFTQRREVFLMMSTRASRCLVVPISRLLQLIPFVFVPWFFLRVLKYDHSDANSAEFTLFRCVHASL